FHVTGVQTCALPISAPCWRGCWPSPGSMARTRSRGGCWPKPGWRRNRRPTGARPGSGAAERDSVARLDRYAPGLEPGFDAAEVAPGAGVEQPGVALEQVVLEGRPGAIGGARVGAGLEEAQHHGRVLHQRRLVQRR